METSKSNPAVPATALPMKPQPVTSSTASTLSTGTIPPTPSLTPLPLSPLSPPPPTALTLSTLPDDILRRITQHLLRPALRGTPYYPPSAPHHLLPLSETCVALRAAVSRHLNTDLHWLRPCTPDDTPSRLRTHLLAWYRFAASNLHILSLSPRLAPQPPVLFDLINTVAAARPRLRTLDLSVFNTSDPAGEHLLATLKDLFRFSRLSLTELRLNLAADFLLDLAADAHLVALTTLDLRLDASLDTIRFLSLLHSLRELTATTSLKPKLDTLHLRLAEPLPSDLRPEAVVTAAPAVKKLHYTELSALGADCTALSIGVLGLAKLFKGLEELVFNKATLDFSLLQPVLERETHRNLTRVALNKCNVASFLTGFPLMRPNAGSLIRGLDLAQVSLGPRELTVLAERCPAVEALGLKMDRGAAASLHRVCKSMPNLESMDLQVVGSKDNAEVRESCRDGIAAAVCATGGKFKKLVVMGETVSVRGYAQIFKTLGHRFEYLVTGVHAPRVSMSRAIMALLAIVKAHCTHFKILCFGLDLPYDPRAEELHHALVETIDGLEDRLPHLDTIWLRRNASSLLDIPKPADFVEVEEDNAILDLGE